MSDLNNNKKREQMSINSKVRAQICLLTMASAFILLSQNTRAAVSIDGWYSSVFGGYTYIPDNINIRYLGKLRHHSTFHPGYNAGLRFGFQSNPLRYEAELTYINAKLQGFYVNAINQHGISGETQATLAMANVYFDFPEMVPAVQPFAGLGLGYGWVNGSFHSTGPLYHTYYSGSNSVFGYQGTVGFTFNFAENFAINLAYRYIGTTRVDSLGKTFQANLATVGVIYRFNEIFYK